MLATLLLTSGGAAGAVWWFENRPLGSDVPLTGPSTPSPPSGDLGLAIDDVRLNEGDNGTKRAAFTVTLSGSTGEIVTVDYTATDGTATADEDYEPISGTLRFEIGDTRERVIVQVIGDTEIEDNEYFLVSLSDPANAPIEDRRGRGTIVDDERPTISVDDVETLEGDQGTTIASFTVSLSAPSEDDITVIISTRNGTAGAGTDYQALSGTATFAPGDTEEAATVQISGDTTAEPDETFFVALSDPTNATIDDGLGRGTILDDDQPGVAGQPTISISDATLTEGNAGSKNATFGVTLSQPGTETVTVGFSTQNGTASGKDYESDSGTVTFSPTDTSEPVTIQVTGDDDPETDETFFVNLSNPTNATIADGQGRGTIQNDDVPSISITDQSVVEGTGAQTTPCALTVTLNGPSGNTITVDFQTEDGTATLQGEDYTFASGTITFAPGDTSETIVIQVGQDVEIEDTENFLVNLFGQTNATLSDNQGECLILDDD